MTERNHNHQGVSRTPEANAPQVRAGKKTFVEPAISSPVDVLEATTFFQAVESGGTTRKPPTD